MQLVSLVLIRWIVIYAVDSPIQCLNNQGQMLITVKPLKSSPHYVATFFLAYM